MANLLSCAQLLCGKSKFLNISDAIYSPAKRRDKGHGKRLRQVYLGIQPKNSSIADDRQRDSFGYCAMHALRDYAQHCGIPFMTLVYNLTREKMDFTSSSPCRVERRLFVEVERLELDPLFDQGCSRKLKCKADRNGCVESTPWVSEYIEKLCAVHESLRARLAADVALRGIRQSSGCATVRKLRSAKTYPALPSWCKNRLTKGNIWMFSSRTSVKPVEWRQQLESKNRDFDALSASYVAGYARRR